MAESARVDVPVGDVVAASMDGMGVIDDGTVVRANERLADIHGYAEAADLVDEPWQSLVSPADRDRIERHALSRAREAGEWQGAIQGRRVDGNDLPLELSVRSTDDDALVWAVREAGGDGPADETEGPDGDHFRRLFDTAPVPIGVISADGEVIYCNREAVDFLGADGRGDIVGRRVEAFVRAEDRDRVRERLQRTIGGREPTGPAEERVIGLDGEERVADAATAPVRVAGEAAAQVVLEDVTERIERERELERYETIIETVEDGVYTLDGDRRFSFVNDGLCELLGLSREEILGTHARAVYGIEEEFEDAEALRERLLERGGRTGTITGTYPTPTGERVLESRYRLYPEPDSEFRGSVGVVRDVTQREERERALERQRDELATFGRINETLFDIIHELVETSTREAVERTVCERLADLDRYRVAWIAERRLDGDGMVPRTSAGDGGGFLASIADTDEGSIAGGGPARQAILTDEVMVANRDSADFEPWREPALERGFESVVAVPLGHRDTVYGALIVFATREDAFSEREQRAFAVLGETVGFAINAIKRRRLLFADAVTELELRITAPESFLSRASERLGCRLTVPGHVSAHDRWILYVDVDGASAERIAQIAANDPTVERARVIDSDEMPERLELVTSDTSLLHRTTPTGVGVRSVEFNGGVGYMVADAPADVDVRDVVEQFDATFGSTELLARQELDRPYETTSPTSEAVEALTDRQRQILEAAFRAGYFSRPRTSTGEEVAESLGITASTFHAHLRKGERSLMSALFE